MKPAQKRIPLFAYLILIVGGLVGIFGLCSGALELFQSLNCKNWPQTEGIIQSAEMIHRNGKHDIYGVKISYSYKVADIVYSGKRVSFGELETAKQAHAQAILDRYPVGKQVAVFYSTANPASAVLETGVHGQTWVTLIVSTSFLGAVLFILLLIRKKVPVGRSPVWFINS